MNFYKYTFTNKWNKYEEYAVLVPAESELGARQKAVNAVTEHCQKSGSGFDEKNFSRKTETFPLETAVVVDLSE